MRFTDILAKDLKTLGIGLLLLSGCGTPPSPPASTETSKSSFSSKIGIRLDRPITDESFEAREGVNVSGTVTLPDAAPVPDTISIQFFAGKVNGGSHVIPLKPTDQENVYAFNGTVKAPRTEGAYTVRAETVIAAELSDSDAPPTSKKKVVEEPGRSVSENVRIRVVAGGGKG